MMKTHRSSLLYLTLQMLGYTECRGESCCKLHWKSTRYCHMARASTISPTTQKLSGKESPRQCKSDSMVQEDPMSWSNEACMPQLLRLCSRAQEPLLLVPQLVKPVCPRAPTVGEQEEPLQGEVPASHKKRGNVLSQ